MYRCIKCDPDDLLLMREVPKATDTRYEVREVINGLEALDDLYAAKTRNGLPGLLV